MCPDASPAFRFAIHADAPALHALIELAYRGEAHGGWDSESHIFNAPRTSLEEVQSLIADENSRFVMTELGGRIVACALIQRARNVDGAIPGKASAPAYFGQQRAGEQPSAYFGQQRAGEQPSAYFGMFAVDSSSRLAGVGKITLAECERQVQEIWRARALAMTVISLRETLIEWYGRRGYTRSGVRYPFPFSDKSGELRNDFDLVELKKTLS